MAIPGQADQHEHDTRLRLRSARVRPAKPARRTAASGSSRLRPGQGNVCAGRSPDRPGALSPGAGQPPRQGQRALLPRAVPCRAGVTAPAASGSRMTNWQPFPALRTPICPRCASMIPRAMLRPSPAPSPVAGVRAVSPRNPTSNTRGRCSAGIPPQESDTLTVAMPDSWSASTSTAPSAGVCRIALTTRLRSARPTAAVSTRTGRPGTAAPRSRTPLARASGSALVSASPIRSPRPTTCLG